MAPEGRLEVGVAIDVLHRAGGRVFLAHPLVYDRDLNGLEQLILELRSLGLPLRGQLHRIALQLETGQGQRGHPRLHLHEDPGVEVVLVQPLVELAVELVAERVGEGRGVVRRDQPSSSMK